jgi:hypothetical protein
MEPVFISYARVDKAIATRLHQDLERRGLSAWIDLRDIIPGSEWSDEIEKAILDCNFFLILLSPRAAASDYVRKEYEFALEYHRTVIPVLIESCEIPEKLRPIQYVDLQDYRAGLSRLLSAIPEALFSKTRSVKSIMNDLKNTDPQIRISALNLIGFGQLNEVLTETINALHDTDYQVRSRAAYALDKLNNPAAIPALLEAMHDSSFDVRSSAGWALVHLGEQIVPPVIEILRDDPDRNARHMAYEVLLRIGSAEAMTAINQYWK